MIVSLSLSIWEIQISVRALNLHLSIERRRTPVAWKTALAMAGAMAMIGVSPPPAGGRSGSSRKWMSICGTSRKRGTW